MVLIIQMAGVNQHSTQASIREGRRFKVYTDKQLDRIDIIKSLPEETLFEMKVVASVLPFRVNEYVINELFNWDKVPNDPIYQLVFPQR